MIMMRVMPERPRIQRVGGEMPASVGDHQHPLPRQRQLLRAAARPPRAPDATEQLAEGGVD